jgi:hypothetical protein
MGQADEKKSRRSLADASQNQAAQASGSPEAEEDWDK